MSFGQKQFWLSVDACSRREVSAKALVEAIKRYEVGELESGWHPAATGSSRWQISAINIAFPVLLHTMVGCNMKTAWPTLIYLGR